MRMFFLAFLLVPLAEIYLLIAVGGAIGAGWTIALVVLTAIIGAAQVSAQGFATLNRARLQLEAGRPPALEMLEGLVLFFVGALLLTPGFVTDAAGFALLVPPIRRRLIKRALGSAKFSMRQSDDGFGMRYGDGGGGGGGGGGDRDRHGRVIDADYEKID